MPLAVTLDDKYLLESGRVYLTGTQALVRLPMICLLYTSPSPRDS